MNEALGNYDIMTLLTLPDHLRKTTMILHQLEKATANQVAEKSHRSRAVESSYLNQLVTMGYIKKMRVSQQVYFYFE
jgi:predicted transcriptional regulator